jgi:hypothetical protein
VDRVRSYIEEYKASGNAALEQEKPSDGMDTDSLHLV